MVYVYLNHTTRCLPGLRARVAEVKIEYAIGENVSISHSDWILKKSEGRKERINHRSLWIHQSQRSAKRSCAATFRSPPPLRSPPRPPGHVLHSSRRHPPVLTALQVLASRPGRRSEGCGGCPRDGPAADEGLAPELTLLFLDWTAASSSHPRIRCGARPRGRGTG